MNTQSGIFVMNQDDTLIAMTRAHFASEDDFQSLIARFPQILAVDQIDSVNPRRFMLVGREVGIADCDNGPVRWAIDHLFLDQDAIPTLVEVKRCTDTRLRREVVGQMLDYAANALRYWPVEDIMRQFSWTCEAAGQAPETVLADVIGADADQDGFWERVKTNLQAGRIRLLFVADIIPPELRRIVEFMNIQMDPAEVLALELRQFAGDNLKTLIPLIIGQVQSVPKHKRPSLSRETRQWDKSAFLGELQRRAPTAADAAQQILGWMEQHAARLNYSQAALYPSIDCVFDIEGQPLKPFRLGIDGGLAIQGADMLAHVSLCVQNARQ